MPRVKILKQYCACYGRPGIDKPPSNCTGERDTHCNRGCFRFFCGTCYLDSTRHSCDLSKNDLPPPKEVKRKSEHAGWGATMEELGEDPNYKQPKGQKLAAIEHDDDLSSSESDSDDSEAEKDVIGQLEGDAAAAAWTTFMQNQGKETQSESHDLARSRKQRDNDRGLEGRKKRSHHNHSDPKTVTPAVRAAEYPGEGLEVKPSGQGLVLFCTYCTTEVSVKKSTLKSHIKGKWHVQQKDKKVKDSTTGTTKLIHDFVIAHPAGAAAAAGSTLPINYLQYRLEVCHAFLIDGIAFECLESQRPLGLRAVLEKDRSKLPCRDVRDCIPKIAEIEMERIKREVRAAPGVSVCFDGTPHVAEVFGVVLRYVHKDKVTHRLVALRFYDKTFSHAQLGQALIDILVRDLQLPREKIRFTSSDGCAVNRAAMVLLEVIFNESANVTCVSHRANIIGKRLKTIMPLAAKFEESWSYLTNNCPTARRMFLHQAGEPAMRSSEIRWYCWYEIIAQVEKKWDAVVSIITDNREFFKETRQKLRDMLGIAQVGPLRKELRTIVDLGDPLVKLCYRTEGDDTLLSTTVYAHWMKVQGLMEELANPVTAVPRLRELLPSLHAAQASDADLREAATKATPLFEKMRDDVGLDGKMASTLRLLRGARLFDIKFIAETPLAALAGIAGEISQVAAIPICAANLAALERELPEYKRLADEDWARPVAERSMGWDFFLAQTIRLPTWALCARDVALLIPSSGTIERAFSLLTQGFDDQQNAALEDYKCTAVKLKYNSIWREKEV